MNEWANHNRLSRMRASGGLERFKMGGEESDKMRGKEEEGEKKEKKNKRRRRREGVSVVAG